MCTSTSTSTTPTFIIEALRRVTSLQLFLNDCYSDVTAYTALIRLVSMTRMDAYITPTNDTNYSFHIKAIELI